MPGCQYTGNGGKEKHLMELETEIKPIFQAAAKVNLYGICSEAKTSLIGSIKIEAAVCLHLFAQGNGAQMAEICRPYINDMGKALPAYGEQMFRQDIIDSVNGNQGRENCVKPLDKDMLDLRLCANGRLVQVTDKDWKPSIRTLPTSSGEKYPFPIFIGKYSGKYWVMA